MKKTALLLTAALMFFLILGVASATEADNVTSAETENLLTEINEMELIDSSSDNILKSSADVENEDTSLKSIESESILTANESSTDNATKVNSQITVSNARYSQTNTIFKVTLKDVNGNTLVGKSITLTVNGKSYKGTTGDDGIANIKAKSLSIGKYTVTAKFNGDNETIKSTFSKKVNVYSSISGRTNPTTSYEKGVVYSATFWKDNAKLTNTNVKFTVNGKKYTVKTDSKGVATLSVTLKPGTYKIKLYNSYSKETTTNTIKVTKGKPKFTASNVYILPKTKFTYSVLLKNSKDKPLKNVNVYFTYNNKQVVAKTDSTGKAKLTLPAFSKGTYTIKYNYKGNTNYKAVSGSSKLYVKDSTTNLKTSALKMQYNDGSLFSVKVTNSAGKALASKNVKFTINGKTSTVKTDSSGVANLAIGNLKPNTYTVTVKYSTAGLKDYNTQKNTVTISKQKATIVASDLVMEYDNLKDYTVTVKNKTGSPIKGIAVQFTFNGKASKITTDANGTATLTVNEKIGYYPVTAELATNTYYTASKVSKHILVNGTKFSASDITVLIGNTNSFAVKLLDGQDIPITGKTITFTLNSKTYTAQTNEKGQASIDISDLTKGTYSVTYTDGKITGTSKINVVSTVTLKQVIAASQNVKKYIESNEELPKTVTIGGVTYTTAQYLYLASQAIINLKANNKGDIGVKSVIDPGNPVAANNLGNLYDYLSVAKSLVSTVNSKGTMPNSVSSNIGTIGYKGLVYAFARVVAFYDDYSIMPNYVTIKIYEVSTSSSLNTKNTISNLKAYLAASTNCQVGNSKIKSVVDSLTSGLTTDKAKAVAIYNYVRDKVSYSFYYDTKYGAVGTLNAKTGNCVDQSHLLIAMFRTAGLAARYAHGTCVFSDGTYGHVWTQVLIGDTWVVADPTSSRNSFGNVVNWNNNNYQLKGYYSSIAF